MAITSIPVSINVRTVFGNKRIVIATLTMGNDTWPSGGVTIAASAFGLQAIEFMAIDSGNHDYHYDYANGKIDAYLPATVTGADAIRVTANGSTPNETVRCFVVGYGGKD